MQRANNVSVVQRRSVLSGLGVLLTTSPAAMADGQGFAAATQFIRDAGQQLATLVQGHPFEAEKRRRLEAFLYDVVDVAGVARFCLGRFWAAATPPQQQDYLRLFRQVLVTAVAVRVGDYPAGQFRVVINTPSQTGSDIQVP